MRLIEAPAALSASIIGGATQATTAYFQNKLNNLTQTMGNCSAVQWAADQFKSATSGETFRRVQAIKTKYRKVMRNKDGIIHIKDLADMQAPPKKMVDYIMANPVLKEYANDGYIEAYGDRYNRAYMERTFIDDPYYRDVTNHMVVKEDDNLVVRNFYSPTVNGSLTIVDKINVLTSWNYANFLIDEGYDPTSEDNNPLG